MPVIVASKKWDVVDKYPKVLAEEFQSYGKEFFWHFETQKPENLLEIVSDWSRVSITVLVPVENKLSLNFLSEIESKGFSKERISIGILYNPIKNTPQDLREIVDVAVLQRVTDFRIDFIGTTEKRKVLTASSHLLNYLNSFGISVRRCNDEKGFSAIRSLPCIKNYIKNDKKCTCGCPEYIDIGRLKSLYEK